MKMSFRRILAIVTAAVMLSALIAGCNRDGGTNEGSTTYKVSIIGSTSVQAVAGPLSEAFEDKYPGSSAEVQGGGSTVGVTQATDGAADIGMASRNLKDSEKGKGLLEYKIAVDGIAVVVHPSNTLTSLTTEQVQDLFSGAITNWSELGGSDNPVVVVSREEGSGTRGAVEEILDLEDKVLQTIVSDSTGAVKATVAGNANAIGYISAGSMDSTVKSMVIDGVECTNENIKSGTYSVSRPFLMLTLGEPNENAKAFLDFVFSKEGQDIVENEGYVRVD